MNVQFFIPTFMFPFVYCQLLGPTVILFFLL